MSTRPPTYKATGRARGPAFDLLAAAYLPDGFYFERSGLGVAGGGNGGFPVARSRDDIAGFAREVVSQLAAVDARDDAVPFACGVLGYRPGTGGVAVATHSVRRTRAGRTLSVDVVPKGGVKKPWVSGEMTRAEPHDAFTDLQLRPTPPAADYAKAVGAAVERIRAGELRKVVLARTIEVEAGRLLDPLRLAQRLRAVDPDAYAFVVPTPDGVMVGASPELLVSRHGREVRSNPLAGSAPRSGDPEEDRANADALVASSKDREEHAIVVEAVAEALGPFCETLRQDAEPVLLSTANVWHLSTRFDGTLRDPAPNALELVAALHPTPAVCGTPREVADALIAELEPFDRGCYAGPVGWMDANGDGEWAIALRCAELRGAHATLYAGAGIVGDSIPDREVDETERKFRAFLDSLRWG